LRYRHILVAAPAYLAGAEALDEPADLRRHRLLGFTKWFDETTWALSNGSRTERVPARLSLGINDYAGVVRAAVAGMGVAEIPSIVCQRELSRGHLVPVLVDWRFEEVNLSAYYLSRRLPSRIVELFLGHCVAHAERVLRSLASPVEPPPRPARNRKVRAR
jgi:DNA-binding transcriptional LysR family regulator